MAWNGGTVKALCDVYGRLYVNKQLISGDNYFAGIAWDDNGIVSGFDSDDEAFMQIILTYGCNDAVTSYNETSATVTINDESVVFNFTDGQLVPVTSAWQQGSTPMFFYRTVNDGSSDVTVVCTPDGELYVDDNDNYIKRVNDGFAWSTGAASQTLITNCGGKVAMDEAAGDDNLMTVISMNDYTVVFTEDGEVTVGAITAYGVIPVSGLVQIFANEDCTAYATGTVNKVYARINEDISERTEIVVDAHDQSDPTKKYKLIVAQGYYTTIDWELSSQSGTIQFWGQGASEFPVTAGVYELTKSGDAVDVTNWSKEFSNE